MKKVCELFGIYEYFIYLCIVIYSCSLFEDINSYNNSFKIVILIIRLNCPFVRNRQFQEVTSELPLFLFMNYAVGFYLRLFICAINDYLIEYDKLYTWKILTPYNAKYGIMLISVKGFGITDSFIYLCNVC